MSGVPVSKDCKQPPAAIGSYVVKSRIGSTYFSQIFHGESTISNQGVVLKCEDAPKRKDLTLLPTEYNFLKDLMGNRGFPNVYELFAPSSSNPNHYIMVMEMLGPSLRQLFERCNRTFSIKTVVQLAVQMINLIEVVHSKKIIHGDIKPENFLIAATDTAGHNDGYGKNLLYLIDFGLSQKFADSSGRHYTVEEMKKVSISAPRYASIRGHHTLKRTRRDDLESLGYCWAFFLRGQLGLPWMGMGVKQQQVSNAKVLEMKKATPIESLFHNFPEQVS